MALAIQAACVDNNSDTNGRIQLAVTPASLAVPQGQSGTATVTLTRFGGFGSAVTLTAEGLPAGVTITFAPSELIGTTASAIMTVTVAGTVPPGAINATLTRSAPGINDISVTCQITVTAATGSAVRE